MRSKSRTQSGFTLMELIGAMAVIAILAAVLAPSLTDGIDRAYSEAEQQNLEGLREALERHVLDSKSIPTQTAADWSAAVADYADLPLADVQFNARGYARRLYVDPSFFSVSAAPFPGYTQGAGLTARPASPRLMLVSDLAGNPPPPPTTSAAFAAIWDQTSSATVVEGKKLKIERLNLAGRFHRLLLLNSSSQQSGYALEGGAMNPVPAASGGSDGSLTRYVLKGSRLAVHFSPFPSGAINTSTLVSDDLALRYRTDGSTWFWERS